MSIFKKSSLKPISLMRLTETKDVDEAFVLSIRSGVVKTAAYVDDVIRALENVLGKKVPSGISDYSGLHRVTGVDVKKAFDIISKVESHGRYAIGDSGTSYGTTQVQLGAFLGGLARDPRTSAATGLSPKELEKLSNAWVNKKRELRKTNVWMRMPVNESEAKEYMKRNPKSVSRRREGTTIRHSPTSAPGIIKVKNGKFTGYVLDLAKLSQMGLNVDANMGSLHKITNEYVTNAVVKNAIAKLFTRQANPLEYAKFNRVFSGRSVNRNKSVRNLADRVSERNLMNKIESVVSAVRESGYNTSAPAAYNIYQLIAISNASGAGRVKKFLFNRKPFSSGHLHYLQRANRVIQKITGLASEFPPRGGMSGFEKRYANSSFRANKYAEEGEEFEGPVEEEREVPERIGLETMEVGYKFPMEMAIQVSKTYARVQGVFKSEPALRHKAIEEYEKELKRKITWDEFDYLVLQNVVRWVEENFKENRRVTTTANFKLSKRSDYSRPGSLFFPGQYAQDICDGNRKVTIRVDDVPVEPGEVVKCMTYSGAPICDVKITAKNKMSVTRIEKAFGKHVAQSLGQKFGPDRQFVVVRFEPLELSEVDDVYDNNNYGVKELLPDRPFEESGAICPMPTQTEGPISGGYVAYNTSDDK